MKTFDPRLLLSKPLLAVLLLFPFLLSTARGDIVVLRSGDKVVGIVQDLPTDPDRALLITATGEVVIPRRQILEHTKEPLSTGYRRIAQVHLERGELTLALQTLEKAQGHEPVDREIPALLDKAREKLIHDGLSRLDAIATQGRQNLDEVETLIAGKEFRRASLLLDEVAATSPTLETLARWTELAADLRVHWGLDREDKLDYVGAATHFQQALEYDPDNPVAIDHLLKVWADDPTRRPEVIRGYERKLARDPEDQTAIRKLADLYVASGDLEAALPHLRTIVEAGRHREANYPERLATAYTTLATFAADERDYEKAKRFYSQLMQLRPATDPAPYHYYDYLQRYNDLEPDDTAGRLELADFLLSKGLEAQALEDVRSVLSREPNNPRALQFLARFAQRQVEEVQSDFEAQRYAMAMAGAREVIQNFTSVPDAVERASDIYARAEIELRRLQRERQTQARELVALGDEYHRQAYYYANQMQSLDRDTNVRILNFRNEAIKFARRGIQAYRQAIQIDSNVGTMVAGDVNNKIRDLQQLHTSLTAPPVPIHRSIGRPRQLH